MTQATKQEQEKAPQPGATSVALVAGGGAVKAYAFHLGVLQGLTEDGFHFRAGPRWRPAVAPTSGREIDTYVGSSAGACIVAALASGHPFDELYQALLGQAEKAPRFGYRTLFVPVAPNPIKYARRLLGRWRRGGFGPQHLLELGGLFTTAGVERYFRRHVLPSNRFADLAARLFLVTTQVNSSRKVVFGPTDSLAEGGYDRQCAYYDNALISHALAAAVAVPPIFAPYGIVSPASGKTFHYYDGEVREPLSMHVATDAGAQFVIASSIWHPYSYEDQVGSLADHGMATVGEQALHQLIEQKVHRERERASQFERLLELIETHHGRLGVDAHATETLQQEVREVLRHRQARCLYVVPEPTDSEFFFHGSFRFGRRTVDRCRDAGYRGYQHAKSEQPEFLAELDRALGNGDAAAAGHSGTED